MFARQKLYRKRRELANCFRQYHIGANIQNIQNIQNIKSVYCTLQFCILSLHEVFAHLYTAILYTFTA